MKYTYSPKKSVRNVANTKTVGVECVAAKRTEYIATEGGQKILRLAYDSKNINRRRFITLMREVVKRSKEDGVRKIALDVDEITGMVPDIDQNELLELMSTSFEMANYEFTQFKAKPEDGWNSVDEVIVIGKVSTKAKEALRRGKIIGEEVNKTRTLANIPGGAMTPAILARKAQEAVKGTKVKVKVLLEKDMKKLKMGAVLGVAQGSSEKPRFIIMEYKGAAESQKPVVFVGKGVTFDTGGLNIKTGNGMLGMNMDMSGGAAAIHAIALAARLKIKRNIVALIPAVENSPSGTSYRPGDVLKTMSGKTVEVLNTDAEGRLILADALTYAKRYKPTLTVDVATLTGAMIMALGQECSGVFTKDLELAEQARALGEKTGEYVWPMPLWDEYSAYLKGNIADVANIAHHGPVRSEGGGSITAATFLHEFAGDLPGSWMHIDIASRMVANAQENLAAGAVGAPVRLLVKLAEEWKK